MRVRKLVTEPKSLDREIDWKQTDISPRYVPIYPKTRPLGRNNKWKTCSGRSANSEYILYALVNPLKDNWQAWLIQKVGDGYSVVSRLEHHGSHPGLHLHSDCDVSGIKLGSQSINANGRIPTGKGRHRRQLTWTEATFWNHAKKFFRFSNTPANTGPLFDQAE